jgi:hypothetical protein
MRHCLLIALLFCGIPLWAQTPDDATVRHARTELNNIASLVASGVLPRARLEDAQNKLADAQDEQSIRLALGMKDFSVEDADAMVALTERRIERRRRALEQGQKLLSMGIIARSEIGDAEDALAAAEREHGWALNRARLTREIVELAKTEQEMMRLSQAGTLHSGLGTVERFVGSNKFDLSQFAAIDKAFQSRFAHALPVSAMGESAVHRSLGFDHRNRVDIALVPDQAEGQWLRQYLTAHNIPFFAFRNAVEGQATGAHIHIGPPSDRYAAQALPKTRVSGE